MASFGMMNNPLGKRPAGGPAGAIQSMSNAVQNSLGNMQARIQNTLGSFSDPRAVAASSPSFFPAAQSPGAGPGAGNSGVPMVFLTSNSIIAKVGFIILVLIVFMYVLGLAVNLLAYLMQSSSSPYIVYGVLDGFDNKIIPSDPKQPNSIAILRSSNQTTGAEYTWSVWLNIRSNNTPSKYQHIFNKGDTNFPPKGSNTEGVAAVNNAPGLYLTSMPTGECILHVVMDVVDATKQQQVIDVEGIPFNQWVHVALRLENKMLDVYVNGIITNRLPLPAVPKQNFSDVNLCQNGGFAGKLSNLRYYNYALSVFELNAIVIGGPTLSPSKLSSMASQQGSPYFLSNLWYNTQYK